MGFTTLVTTVARFRHTSESEGLIRHIGAISELAGMRYWSTTHKQWQTLIVDAYALTDQQPGQRREDFTPDEMKEGKILYFEQVDNLSGKAIYRMHIAERLRRTGSFFMLRTSARCAISSYLSFSWARCSRSTFWIANRITSGAITASCAQESNANRLIAGNESSSVNRAVAFYRHRVGIPTDQKPPAER